MIVQAIGLTLMVAALVGALCLGWFLCSRTQSNRMDAAISLAKLSADAAGQVLDSAHKMADVGTRLAANTSSLEDVRRGLAALRDVVDSLDKGQGSIVNMLVNSDVIGGIGGQMRREAQVGDSPVTLASRTRMRPAPLAPAAVDEVPVATPAGPAPDGAR